MLMCRSSVACSVSAEPSSCAQTTPTPGANLLVVELSRDHRSVDKFSVL